MTHAEKLDAILNFILAHDNNATYQSIFELNFPDHASLMRELRVKGYINDRQNGANAGTYYVEKSGEMFIENGGYIGQKKREERNSFVSESTLWWTKKAAIAAIAAAILSAIAIIIQFCITK
jgi:hypothetical protein